MCGCALYRLAPLTSSHRTALRRPQAWALTRAQASRLTPRSRSPIPLLGTRSISHGPAPDTRRVSPVSYYSRVDAFMATNAWYTYTNGIWRTRWLLHASGSGVCLGIYLPKCSQSTGCKCLEHSTPLPTVAPRLANGTTDGLNNHGPTSATRCPRWR